MNERMLRVDGLRLRCYEQGDAGAPGALVLHGIMGHAREWDTLTTALAADHRVVALDQRGHGGSDHAGDYRIAALARDAAAVIESPGLAPVDLVGHSLGAMAAIVCAADRPELVRRLVLLDVGPEALETAFGQQELPAMLAAMGRMSYASVHEAVAQWLAGNPLARERHLRHYVRHCLVPGEDGRLRWRFDAAGLAEWAVCLIEPAQLWSAIDRVSAPTLLVRGEHSPLLSRPGAAEIVRRLADGRLVEIPNAGHDLGVEQPEAVAEAVRSFLAATTPRPAQPATRTATSDLVSPSIRSARSVASGK